MAQISTQCVGVPSDQPHLWPDLMILFRFFREIVDGAHSPIDVHRPGRAIWCCHPAVVRGYCSRVRPARQPIGAPSQSPGRPRPRARAGDPGHEALPQSQFWSLSQVASHKADKGPPQTRLRGSRSASFISPAGCGSPRASGLRWVPT
jgi:hypothetical protein